MKLESIAVAGRELGHAFLSPDMVMRNTTFRYSMAQLKCLEKSAPSVDVLKQVLLADCILFPSPPMALCLQTLRVEPFLGCFYQSAKPWYMSSDEGFAQDEFLPVASWMTLRITKLEGAKSQIWPSQVKSAESIGLVPHTAVGAAYGIMLYSIIRGTRLFRNYEVRTSSFASTGEMVTLGTYLDIGLPIKRADAKFRAPTLNIALQYPL
jgi:hypothetical protein